MCACVCVCYLGLSIGEREREIYIYIISYMYLFIFIYYMLETSALFFQITQPFAWTSHAKGVKREKHENVNFVNFSCALKRENVKT